MFLIDRLPSPAGLRPELAPRQLFGGTGDLVRTALMTRPPVHAGATKARHPAAQFDFARPQPARRRKVG
ncbi:MAG TPA: hypothetical protein VFZ03_01515 [Dongiaceae bacterium]